MSKRQDKIAQRKAEAAAFVAARLSQNLALFEQNFEVGKQLYEANKDRLTEEQRVQLEEDMEKNRRLIDEIKSKASSGA